MISINDIEKIEKYLEGKLSATELKEFKQQLNNNPELAEMTENFKFAIDGVNVFNRNQLKAKLGQIQKEVAPALLQGKSSVKYYIGGAAIAVLIALFFIINPFSKQKSNSTSNQEIKVEKDIAEVRQNLSSGGNVNTPEPSLKENNNTDYINNTGEIIKTSKTPDEVPSANMVDNNPAEKNNNQLAIDQKSNSKLNGQKVNNILSDDIPQAKFAASKSNGCVPLNINFTDQSSITNGSISKWLWEFGDGKTSTLQNPSHSYKNAGIYSVKLTVWSKSGKYDILTNENMLTAHLVPDARFISDPEIVIANRPDVQFKNTTKNATQKTTYKWDFGDHFGSSTEFSPEYRFVDTGTYIISLTATTENGCVDKVLKGIIVVPEVSCYMPTAFSPDGRGPSENNIYQISATGFTGFHMIIYSREGEIVYETNEYKNHGWDGTYPNANNQFNEVEVLIVKLRLIGFDGKEYNYKQSITLSR